MTDFTRSIFKQYNPNVIREPVAPIEVVKQEVNNEWTVHEEAFQAQPSCLDFSILDKIYDKLLASEKHNRRLEQKINDIERTVKERVSKAMDFAQEAVQSSSRYLDQASRIVDSQRDAMDQWRRRSDDRLEDINRENKTAINDIQYYINDELKDLKSRLKEYGGIVETTAKNSEANKEVYSDTLKEMQRQICKFTEFLSNNSTGNMQSISEILKTSNIETNKTMTNQLERFSEGNFSGFRKVRAQLNQFGEALANINPAEKADSELKAFKEQCNEIQKKLDEIRDSSSKPDEIHGKDFKKLRDSFNQFLSYCQNRTAENNFELIHESEKTREALTQLKGQMTKIEEKLDKQKDPGAVFEKLQRQLKRIKEILKKEGQCDDSDDEEADVEEKEPCFFCRYTDHKSNECHVFSSTRTRVNKLDEFGICEKCLKPNCYRACPNVTCQNCIAENIRTPFFCNHHPTVCTFKKKRGKQ